ncbi:MAG: hypothetical protein ACR2MD_04995 [Aridibacter sp.]
MRVHSTPVRVEYRILTLYEYMRGSLYARAGEYTNKNASLKN